MNSNRVRKLQFMIVVLLVSVLFLSACKSETTSTDQEKVLRPFQVMLDWYPNAVHSFLYLGQQKGYFKDAGLDVKFLPPGDVNDPIKLVATGKIDLAISYQRQVIQSRAQGLPVVSVAAIVRHPLNQLMVRGDLGVKSPKDLIGKTIGYASSDIDVSLVKAMIQSDGGNSEQVKFIDIGYDLVPAMLNKKVDAIIGGYVNHEKVILEKNGMQITTLDPSTFGLPNSYELVLVTSEQTWTNLNQEIRDFWRAATRAQEEVSNQPKAALELLLSQQMKEFPLEADVEQKSLDMLIPLMKSQKEAFGAQSSESWQAVIEWMKNNQHITKDVKAEEVFRNIE